MGRGTARWGSSGDPLTTPADAAASVAEKIPSGELETYDTDHFSPYRGETFEAFVADQLAFLRRHVRVASS